jgi:hypothetical protein
MQKRELMQNPLPVQVPPLTTSTSGGGGERFYSTLRVSASCDGNEKCPSVSIDVDVVGWC